MTKIFLFLFGLILHFLFLISIFYIYFQSPILQGLTPQNDLHGAPANRLVLFVADGLRAESFIRDNLERTPFLKSIVKDEGIFGISHTRVPTESRPGHCALIAGVYEDPSAILKGWQENPVEFDSVFNRSRVTYSWGSPDILPIFAKGAVRDRVWTYSYTSADESFSGQKSSALLDSWVFERVKEFLGRDDNVRKLKETTKSILFLHLLGLDTAGHVYKPNTERFDENLRVVDEGIKDIVRLVTSTIGEDGKTAFVFTSDHGMTDRGAHGDGSTMETETPLIAWGSGIGRWKGKSSEKVIFVDGVQIPRFDLEQIDIAPLMATLIGVGVPMNNFGRLPHQYLNVSTEYLAAAMQSNAKQLLLQYKKLYERTKKKKFKLFISHDEYLIENSLAKLEYMLRAAVEQKEIAKIVALSEELIDQTREAIEFYQSYYKKELLLALSLTIVGWVILLLQHIGQTRTRTFRNERFLTLFVVGGVLSLIAFNWAQDNPPMVILYFVLPILTWYLVVRQHKGSTIVIRGLLGFLLASILVIFTSEMMVLSFFHRWILTIFLLLQGALEVTLLPSQQKSFRIKFMASVIALAIFPSLPVVRKDSKHDLVLFIGVVLWALKSFIGLYRKRTKYQLFQSGMFLATSANFVILLLCLQYGEDSPWINQFLCWIISLAAIFGSLFSSLDIQTKITAIENNLAVPFILMSLSYEPLFLFAFTSNLKLWIEAEFQLHGGSLQFEKVTFKETKISNERELNLGDIRRICSFMVYLLVSLFGTGNMASMSSFDPNWVRCFVSTFSPFLMAGLIVIKLAVPIQFLSCILKAMQVVTKINVQKLFIVILIICDIMCLNFLFLVRNKGSWLEIGSSISHFIIMESTVLVLGLLYALAHLFTSISLTEKTSLPYFSKINKH